MGNCQAAEAEAVVIQHPGGRVERLYWPTPAGEVMRSNPGHHVAHITILCRLPGQHPQQAGEDSGGGGAAAAVRLTRVRVFRPKDTLVPGQVYRLVTSQEVIKGLRARKQEKMRVQMELAQGRQQHRRDRFMKPATGEIGPECETAAATGGRPADPETYAQVAKQERNPQKMAQVSVKSRQWRPSLQSIAEVGS